MEAELRRAVFEHPDDDAPRYVYADWLMERGDAYGRFITAQLRGETSMAMALFGDIVLRASAGVAVNPQLGHFKRGFLTELFLSAEANAETDPWPLIEQLRMLGAGKDAALVREVGAWPALRSLVSQHGLGVSAMASTGRGALQLVRIHELRMPVEFGALIDDETEVMVSFLRRAVTVRRDAQQLSISIGRSSVVEVPGEVLGSVLRALARAELPVSLAVLPGCDAEARVVRAELSRVPTGPVTERVLLTIG